MKLNHPNQKVHSFDVMHHMWYNTTYPQSKAYDQWRGSLHTKFYTTHEKLSHQATQ